MRASKQQWERRDARDRLLFACLCLLLRLFVFPFFISGRTAERRGGILHRRLELLGQLVERGSDFVLLQLVGEVGEA
jgi:hypothetical protein